MTTEGDAKNYYCLRCGQWTSTGWHDCRLSQTANNACITYTSGLSEEAQLLREIRDLLKSILSRMEV